ncbi:NAD(P)-binding protein [Wolfiporia cocos MD-104 SS10]|uniref:NAD(P)-binding protein n=1 Tax=Wolfiporia cocos (strain MD-104) TaxID=742152 RepID=A0A2H3JWL0_WOLCO|nr:NAD(P)-binding protein [Wolfiporia cocos MD-104 SS10]
MSSKVWLITGATSGIGLALAEYVLSQGDSVIATGRSLAKFPSTLKDAGAKLLVLDLSSTDAEIRRAGEEALKIYGHIDILFNNAGFGLVVPVEELDLDDLRAQFQTNVFGAVALTQALLPSFRERKSGHILNVSSMGAIAVGASWSAYCASKAALDAFSEVLSMEVAPYNIRVLIVTPGFFATNFFQASTQLSTAKPSTIYTDQSQGYRSLEEIPKARAAAGQIGDVVKLSERLYEVVHGIGMAQGLVEGQGGKREWLRVPLGPDCGERMLHKIAVLEENVKAFEPIWRSTDMEPEKLKLFTNIA